MSHVLNLPNSITAFRFVLAGCLAVMLLCKQTTVFALLTFAVFLIAALSDFVDGYLARRFNTVTVLGKLLDPLADKVLVTTGLIMLIPLGRVPAWIALLMLCREMIVTGLRGVASSAGVVVAASWLGKWKSTFQYIALGTLIFPADFLPIPGLHVIGAGILYIALFLTVWSGCDYFYKLRHVFLQEPAS